MRNDTRQRPLLIEDDAIRAGTPTIIVLKVVEDRKLQIRTGHTQFDVLVVAECMRIVPRPFCLAGLEKLKALGDGGADRACEVAHGAARGGAGLSLAFGQVRVEF